MTSRIVRETEPQYLMILSNHSRYTDAKAERFRVGASKLAQSEATMRAFGWQHISISEMAYSETLGKYVTIPE